MLILKAISLQPLHGYGILLRLGQISGQAPDIPQGSLFPALYRLEHQRLIEAEWGVSDNNRKATHYRLTRGGRRRLKEETVNWNRFAAAIAACCTPSRCARCDWMNRGACTSWHTARASDLEACLGRALDHVPMPVHGAPCAIDIAPWSGRVRYVDATCTGTWELPMFGEVAAPAAVLIRPDGYVAWVGDGTPQRLTEALTTWSGTPPKR